MVEALTSGDLSPPSKAPLPDKGYQVTVHLLYRPHGAALAMMRAEREEETTE